MAAEGAVAATAAGVAAGAFGYNRSNYQYDAEMRFERFASGREYANQQSEQYREDLRTMAGLTVKKNTLWAVTSTLCMALCVALYCAGRLGLHGPSPPTWLMGLWLTNNAAAFGFMAVTTFLALHASFRAQAASVHLLTRKVRLPIPSLKQLDQARRFGSEFEQQSFADIFRVPYLSNNGAPKTDDACYDGEAPAEGKGRRSSSAPPSRSKCSSWVRQEFEQDRMGTVPPSGLPDDAAPEHFRLYSAVQREFYQHDIYARVGIFLGFSHYFQSLCYYGLGHINIELRAFWVAYACVFVLAVLFALILRFDIIAQPGRKQRLPKCEFCGPVAVLFAAIGMSLEFRVEFDVAAIALTWVLVFIAYILQLVYSLRILEVVLPDEQFEGLGERLGASWLPQGFNKVPSSFYHVLYSVAAPERLQPGQHDIVREIKEGGKGATGEVLGSQADSVVAEEHADDRRYHQVLPLAFNDTNVAPWKLLAAICMVLPCMWVFLIFGTIVDVAIGEQGLVTAPHWSRPPMTRLAKRPHELGTPLGFPWPAGKKPYLPEQMAWHEEKRHADEYSFNRRLSTSDLNATVQELLEVMAAGSGDSVAARDVAWPSFFEPRVLACAENGEVAAITPRGFGAAVPASAGSAEAFRLSGLTHSGPIVAASLGRHAGRDGLLLASKSGDLVSCPGARPAAGGVWACAPAAEHGLPKQLPLAARSLTAAAIASFDGTVHVAVILAEDPEVVAVYAQDGDAWMPFGELRVAPAGGKTVSLSFASSGHLLVANGAGRVARHGLFDGTVATAHHNVARGESAWQAACAVDGQVAHLSWQKQAVGWSPLLSLADLPVPGKPAVFA